MSSTNRVYSIPYTSGPEVQGMIIKLMMKKMIRDFPRFHHFLNYTVLLSITKFYDGIQGLFTETVGDWIDDNEKRRKIIIFEFRIIWLNSNFDLTHLDANQPWFILNVSQLSARVLIALLFHVPRNHSHFWDSSKKGKVEFLRRW